MKGITIKLTPAQKKKLAPFFEQVMTAFDESERLSNPDLRMAILGQAHGDGEEGAVPSDREAGGATFYLLTGAQRKIVNVAILKAKKLKGAEW